MSSFEYVMVLVSIILGLGMTVLLRGAIDSWSSGSEAKPGLLHSLWVLAALLAHVQLWALRWGGEQRTDWPGLVVLSFLLVPVLYYAMAELLYPPPGRAISLSEFLLENRQRFFGLWAACVLGWTFGGVIHYGDPAPRWELLMALPGLLFFSVSRNERLHIAWALFWVASLVWQIAILDIG